MIRIAVPEDAEALAGLCSDVVFGFARELFNFEKLPEQLRSMIEEKSVIVFVDDVDGKLMAQCMGSINRVYWNMDEQVAYVLAWWSRKPGHGKPVFDAFVDFSTKYGAKKILAGARDERTEKIYQRMDWFPVERNYMKELG